MNFAKKQSDNLEQQETELPSALQSPLGRLLSLFRRRPAPTELRALVADEPEDLDTEDEGLISFEEERVSGLREGSRRQRLQDGGQWPRGRVHLAGWARAEPTGPLQTLETGRLRGLSDGGAGVGAPSRGRSPWEKAGGERRDGESTPSPGSWGRHCWVPGAAPNLPSAVCQAQLSFNTDTLC